ncbi:hypothetical protein HY947_06605 [Candidatus Gottesmanbacteria bacterium]|nr:hypothetical protein [Candidatus Gottesmanbacteria bacterium]
MYTLLADETKLGQIGGSGLGPWGDIGKSIGRGDVAGGTTALVAVTKSLSSIIGFMTIAAGVWFIFQFIIGGFYWITSGGDKNKLHEARERITNAAIGLLIVVAGWAILSLASLFTGVDLIISNPGKIIEQLNIK